MRWLAVRPPYPTLTVMPARSWPTRHPRIAAAFLALFAATLLSGCVASESSRYKGTVSRSVQPASNATSDVASAFGLRSGDGRAVSLAAVEE